MPFGERSWRSEDLRAHTVLRASSAFVKSVLLVVCSGHGLACLPSAARAMLGSRGSRPDLSWVMTTWWACVYRSLWLWGFCLTALAFTNLLMLSQGLKCAATIWSRGLWRPHCPFCTQVAGELGCLDRRSEWRGRLGRVEIFLSHEGNPRPRGTCVLGSVGGALSPGSREPRGRSSPLGAPVPQAVPCGREGNPKPCWMAAVLERRWHELACGPG